MRLDFIDKSIDASMWFEKVRAPSGSRPYPGSTTWWCWAKSSLHRCMERRFFICFYIVFQFDFVCELEQTFDFHIITDLNMSALRRDINQRSSATSAAESHPLFSGVRMPNFFVDPLKPQRPQLPAVDFHFASFFKVSASLAASEAIMGQQKNEACEFLKAPLNNGKFMMIFYVFHAITGFNLGDLVVFCSPLNSKDHYVTASFVP